MVIAAATPRAPGAFFTLNSPLRLGKVNTMLGSNSGSF